MPRRRFSPDEKKSYVGTPCCACGYVIREGEQGCLVFAGYAEGNRPRAAHGTCYEFWPDRGVWAEVVEPRPSII